MSNFKVDEAIVRKVDEFNTLKPREDILVIKSINTDLNQYEFDNGGYMDINHCNEKFIRVLDVLWYFEEYDFMNRTWSQTKNRHTLDEMNKLYASYHDTAVWKPMYSLGFALPVVE